MPRQIIITGDGSHTITNPEGGATYHSVFGAMQESRHVFIEAGLMPLLATHKSIHILEIGFGTGLNALLTACAVERFKSEICYTAIEPFPLTEMEITSLNYCRQPGMGDSSALFRRLHSCEWEKEQIISPGFTLVKTCRALDAYYHQTAEHLIYFDAFAPAVQPELWTEAIFRKLFHVLAPGGWLVTYCSKGDVRRAMLAAGFAVEKLAGPPGKREMIRARREC